MSGNEQFDKCGEFAARVPPSGTLRVTYNLTSGGSIELGAAGTDPCPSITECLLPRLLRRDAYAQRHRPTLVRLLRRFADAIVARLPPTAGIELGLHVPARGNGEIANEPTDASIVWPAFMQAVLVAATRAGRRCDVRHTVEMDSFIESQFVD